MLTSLASQEDPGGGGSLVELVKVPGGAGHLVGTQLDWEHWCLGGPAAVSQLVPDVVLTKKKGGGWRQEGRRALCGPGSRLFYTSIVPSQFRLRAGWPSGSWVFPMKHFKSAKLKIW